MNYFSIAIGSVGGGLIVTYFGFSALFTLMGVLSIVSGIYVLFLPKNVLN